MTSGRDNNIDILRALGLACIMLAHVLPPAPILNIRCFDVPLMVFVSGLTCYQKQIPLSLNYTWHRIKRLVIPVWIFLCVYFSLIIFAQWIMKIDLGLTKQFVWDSFFFQGEVAFLWIIRVFLLIALLTPLLIHINNSINSNGLYGIFVLCLFCCFSCLMYFRVGVENWFIKDYVYYTIGYSIVFLCGVRVKACGQIIKLSIVPLLMYILLYILNGLKINNLTEGGYNSRGLNIHQMECL